MQEPTVTSPYYFVPAPKEAEVYKPDWSHQVSHDIPFSDGESGEIHLDIRAMSPLFIRNGHGEDEKGKKDNRFCHIGEGDDKRYFLPASSLKGMIRNLVEIL
ncbi:MAG: RAMP superfamily CRISPR-associated protein, partial [Bacteroidota bacterium]